MAVLSLKIVKTRTKAHSIAVTSYVSTDKFSTVQTNVTKDRLGFPEYLQNLDLSHRALIISKLYHF